jgi:hypothetical protein
MVYGFDLGFAGGHRYRDYVIDADQFPGQP